VFAGSLVENEHGFSKRVAVFLGWISYPVYCLHWPVGRIVFSMAGGGYYLNWVPAIIASALTLALAVILTKYVDEPVRGRLTAMLSPSRGATSERP
jgi:peptidoglycan/LPS O-acetylase OafA/YrhL